MSVMVLVKPKFGNKSIKQHQNLQIFEELGVREKRDKDTTLYCGGGGGGEVEGGGDQLRKPNNHKQE